MILGYANVAGFNIETKSDFVIPGFETNPPINSNADICVEVTQEQIDKFRSIVGYKMSKFSCAASIVLEGITDFLAKNDSILFHGATFEVDEQGIAFSAASGTGKTTHMLNWQKYLGDRLTIVNGDKPIVRFLNGNFSCPIAYDTPWNGSERLGNSGKTILKHICFIERSETNFVTDIKKEDAIGRLIKQIYMPKNPIIALKTLDMVDKLLENCELWFIHCNMEEESAKVAYETIFGKQ